MANRLDWHWLVAEHVPGDQCGNYYTMKWPSHSELVWALCLPTWLYWTSTSLYGKTSPTLISWGWRMLFLLSAIIEIIVLYVHINIAELRLSRSISWMSRQISPPSRLHS